MEDLKSKITEKRKLDNECAKLLLEAQKSQVNEWRIFKGIFRHVIASSDVRFYFCYQKPHMRAIRMSTEKNLENIENLILKQEEELRNLLKWSTYFFFNASPKRLDYAYCFYSYLINYTQLTIS